MKYFKVFIIFFTLVAQPLSAGEKSVLFTVDMTQLFRSSEFGKNIIAANNIARKKLQSENQELEKKLLLEEKELSELRKTLSVEEFRPKALEFDKRVSIIREEQGKKEEFLNKKVRKEETDFFKRIYPLLYEILIERGGLILVDQRNIILWDNSVDITDDAIQVINKALESDFN
jgi:Skp family chaperone for outer membrane proteins